MTQRDKDIQAPVRDLGEVRSGPLQAALARLDAAAWRADAYRQDSFEVHRATESVLLLFLDAESWPRLDVRRGSGWPPLGGIALDLMRSIVAAHYSPRLSRLPHPPGQPEGVFLRAMAVRLPSGGRIAPHRDTHASFRCSHRIHVPLATNARVRFLIDGAPHRLAAGRAFEIDNQRPHSVVNGGADPRDHFIFDYLPPSRLVAPDLAREDAP